MKISVIVSTYNRPDALNAVLAGFCQQKELDQNDWELIIADDGSREPTMRVIEQYRPFFGENLKHVWHPDNGFRLAEIRNKAALESAGDYLVFLDGDCIPMSDFVSQHQRLAESGKVVAGNRILLSKTYTSDLLISSRLNEPCSWGVFQWFLAKWSGKTNKALGWLRLDLEKYRNRRANDWRVLRGCNIGVWRKDFLIVDGFDASFSGWGYEDSDFAVRMLRLGVHIKDGRFAVPVLHLWHPENDRSSKTENWNRFERSLKGNRIEALKGISSL